MMVLSSTYKDGSDLNWRHKSWAFNVEGSSGAKAIMRFSKWDVGPMGSDYHCLSNPDGGQGVMSRVNQPGQLDGARLCVWNTRTNLMYRKEGIVDFKWEVPWRLLLRIFSIFPACTLFIYPILISKLEATMFIISLSYLGGNSNKNSVWFP